MPAFPITVRHGERRVGLVVRLAQPRVWSQVRPAVCEAAGLPPDTVLYHGARPVPEESPVGMPPLLAGCTVETEAGEVPIRPPVVLTVLSGPDAGRSVPVGTGPITIGRDPGCALALTDPAVSFRHAVLRPGATGFDVYDEGSTNGVVVDGVRLTVAHGRAGSLIRVGNSLLQVQLTAEPGGAFRPDGDGHLSRAWRGPRTVSAVPPLPSPPTAPRAGGRRTVPVVSAVVGAVLGAALAAVAHNPMFLALAALGPVTMIGTAVGDRVRGRSSLRRARTRYVAAHAEWRATLDDAIDERRRAAWEAWPGPAELLRRAQAGSGRLWDRTRADRDYLAVSVGIGTALAQVGDGSGADAAEETRAGAQGGVATASGADPANASRGVGPGGGAEHATEGGAAEGGAAEGGAAEGGAARNLMRVRTAKRRAAENRATHGTEPRRSARRAAVRGSPPRERLPAREPAVRPGAAIAISDMPMALKLGGVIALTGSEGRGVARWILAQLAAFHSPADLALALVAPNADLLPAADLPHALGPVSPDETDPVAHFAGAAGRDVVVVLDGARALESAVGHAALALAADPSRPIAAWSSTVRNPLAPPATRVAAVLCLADSSASLPSSATAVSVRSPPRPPAASTEAHAGPITPTGIGADRFEELCAAFAPLRDSTSADAALPQRLSLTALIDPMTRDSSERDSIRATSIKGTSFKGAAAGGHVGGRRVAHSRGVVGGAAAVPRAVEGDPVRRRWQAPTLRATIGVDSAGPVAIDLQVDGPHVLIAGTTGSGKSELLLTLISSLALSAGPAQLTFLLVDYKGGSAFRAVANLPHVVGMVTDLDPALSTRALTSLRAELRRRERLAAAGTGVPALVVVVDEFATLAVELPEFLAGVLDIAQRGRSLGLHLVLATQRPAGVVTPAIRANISTRICLRVTDPADSIDIIGTAEASYLSARDPGRAFLTTGAAPRMFQTALVTMAAPPAVEVTRRNGAWSGFSPARCDPADYPADGSGGGPTGEQAPNAPAAPRVPGSPALPALEPGRPPTVVETIVAVTREAAQGQPPPRRPWLEPLPREFHAPDDEPLCIALVDLPNRQTQRTMDLPESSLLITGPPRSGRSTALRRAALIAARRGAEVLIIDPVGGLADLSALPAVTTYLDLAEPALVLRLLAIVSDPARRPPDSHPRYLIIDRYDLVAAELERADFLAGPALLAELGSRAGESVRVVAAGPEALRHQRASAAFPTAITLASPSDGAPPGRGRFGATDIQIVTCPPGSHSVVTGRPGRGRHAEPADREAFAAPVIVRRLPRKISSATLPLAGGTRVPFGIGDDDARVLTVDLGGPGGAIVVAGRRRSGVSNALAVLIDQASRAGVPVVVLHAGPTARPRCPAPDPGRAPRRPEPRTLAIGNGCDELRALLSAHRGPLLLVADHHAYGEDYPAAEVLLRFLAVCGPGQHLVVGARSDVLAQARRGHLRAALGYRRGLILAPDTMDGSLFDITVPKRPVALPGRGLWVEGGRVLPVQVALRHGETSGH